MGKNRAIVVAILAFLLGAAISRLLFPPEPQDLRRAVDQLNEENKTLRELVDALERQSDEVDKALKGGRNSDSEAEAPE